MKMNSDSGFNYTSCDLRVLYTEIYETTTEMIIMNSMNHKTKLGMSKCNLSSQPGFLPVSLGSLCSAVTEKKPMPSTHRNRNLTNISQKPNAGLS